MLLFLRQVKGEAEKSFFPLSFLPGYGLGDFMVSRLPRSVLRGFQYLMAPAARQGCERRRARSLAVPPASLSAARSCDAARARGRLCRGMRRRRRRRLSARLKQWQQFVGRRERLGPAPGGGGGS